MPSSQGFFPRPRASPPGLPAGSTPTGILFSPSRTEPLCPRLSSFLPVARPQGSLWPGQTPPPERRQLSIYRLQVNGGRCGSWGAPRDSSASASQAFSPCSAQAGFSLACPSVNSAACTAGPGASMAISCSHLVEMKEGQGLEQQGSGTTRDGGSGHKGGSIARVMSPE